MTKLKKFESIFFQCFFFLFFGFSIRCYIDRKWKLRIKIDYTYSLNSNFTYNYKWTYFLKMSSIECVRVQFLVRSKEQNEWKYRHMALRSIECNTSSILHCMSSVFNVQWLRLSCWKLNSKYSKCLSLLPRRITVESFIICADTHTYLYLHAMGRMMFSLALDLPSVPIEPIMKIGCVLCIQVESYLVFTNFKLR